MGGGGQVPEEKEAARRAAGNAVRVVELDSLRGIAALWVVIFHMSYGVDRVWRTLHAGQPNPVSPFTLNIEGMLAVDLFFLISGFVITMTVERSASWRSFAVSRISRLYPAYWAAVLISAAVIALMPLDQPRPGAVQIAANLTMLHLYLRQPNIDPSYWSLAVELGFYLLVGVLLVLGQLRRIEAFAALWMLAGAGATLLLPALGHALPWRITTGLALPWSGLFTSGIFFYHMRRSGWHWRGVAVILFALITRAATLAPHAMLIEAGIFASFALFAGGRLPWLRAAPLLFLGQISYSLYLIHQPMAVRLEFLLHELGLPRWPGFALALAVVLAAATLLNRAVEQPSSRACRRALASLLRA